MTYTSTIGVFLIGTETAWGTAVTADKDCGLLISTITPGFEREIIESQSIGAIDTQKITTGAVGVSLSVEGDFQHGRLLEYVFGTVAHAETTDDWKHTFTIANDPTSLTAEVSLNSTTDTVLTHTGMLAETTEISIELNGNLKMTTEFKGKSTLSSDSSSGSTISTLPVFPHALCGVTLLGVVATEIQSASVSINKTIERSGGIGSNLYQQGHATELKCEWSCSLGFTDKSWQELMLGGTAPTATSDPAALGFILNADNGVTLGSGRREFKLTLDNCQTASFSQPIEVGGLVFIEASGSGLLSEMFTVDNITSVAW